MSTDEYAVVIEAFAERHFIKGFSKKYKKAWGITLRAIIEEVQRAEALIGRNACMETISNVHGVRIIKMEFRVAGTHESRHTSGNRCIIALHADNMTAFVLLVYCKTDVRGSRETDWWQRMVRDNFSRYKHLI
jgi:hypothetical protein